MGGNHVLFWRRRHPIGDQELNAYVDGQLPAADRVRLEEHVEACAGCREALEELRALQGALRELPSEVAPRPFALREADVRPPVARRPVGALGRAGPLLGGVTAAALVAFGALVGVDVGVPGTESSQEASDSVVSAPEEPQAETLQDADELAPVAGGLESETNEAGSDTKKALDEAPDTGGNRSFAGGAPPPADATTPECPDCPDDAFTNRLGPALTPECPPTAACVGAAYSATNLAPGEPSPLAPTPAAVAQAEAAGEAEAVVEAQEDDRRTPLRVAEGATAALAIVAASSLALVWWRRRV